MKQIQLYRPLPARVQPRSAAILAVLAALAVASGASAQSTPPAPVEAKAAEEEVMVLSPFVVNTERDTGYQAQSTLAGNRLNTPIKDLGASLTVFTKDLIDDIGATNTNALLIYAPNMEAAGAGGNTSAVDGQSTSENARNSPQETARTRGLATPSFSRNYFLTSIPTDSYNVQSVSVNRGPNAILFGVGSPAGVVDSTLSRANLGKNTNRAIVRYGNNDSLRAVLDVNRVLVDDKLALRLVGLDTDERFNQRPAFEKQSRLFGAVTASPFRSTTIRGNFETGKIRANRPITVVPLRGFSDQWFNGGRPVFDWRAYDDPALHPQGEAGARAAQAQNNQVFLLGGAQIFGQTVIPYNSVDSLVASDLSFDSTIGNSSTAINAVRPTLFHQVLNRDLGVDNVNFIETRANNEIPAANWPGGRVPAGIRPQGFTDTRAFDWRNRMIDETSRQRDDFRAYNISIEQLAWDNRVGVELTYNKEKFRRFTKNSFFSQANGSVIRIDPNVALPYGDGKAANGTPLPDTGNPKLNPNLGRPYAMYGQSSWNHSENERENLRGTAFIKYDFKELSPSWGKWLGRHTLTGLIEKYTADSIFYQTKLLTSGVQGTNISTSLTSFTRIPYLMVYLGDSILNGGELKLNAIRIPEIREGVTSNVVYFSNPANSTTQGSLVAVENPLIRVLGGNNYQAQREVIKSKAAILQSYWLDDLLVTTVGWRRDASYNQNHTFGVLLNPGQTDFKLNDFKFMSTPPAGPADEVISHSAVLRWPRKLVRLPQGTDLSAFYNSSENFTPLGNRRDPFNNRMASPKGKTKEFGLNLWVLDEKLAIRASRFETSVVGASLTSNPLGTILNNIIRQGVEAYATERNLNPHIDRTADIQTMVAGLPANYLSDIVKFNVIHTPSNTAAPYATTWTPVSGVTDTQDFKATGTEIELVFNPNRQWRFIANVSNQKTVATNVAPFTRDMVERMTPAITALGPLPRLRYPTGWVPGQPQTMETLADYVANNLSGPLATILASEGRASDEQARWRANAVANYTFARDSKFRGWSVGGGVRWQDKVGIGYPASYAPNGATVLDIENPYYAKAELNADGWIGYSRRIWKNKINWSVRLNMQNLWTNNDLIPIRTQGDGTIALVRTPPERRWYLTNTFDF